MWIYRIYERNIFRSQILVTLVIFVAPWAMIFLPYFITRSSYLSSYSVATIISLILAGSWAFLGPLLIKEYYILIDDFYQKIFFCIDSFESDKKNVSNMDNNSTINYEILNVRDNLSDIFKCEKNRQIIRVKIVSILWVSLVITILLIFNQRLKDFAFFGFSDIYYWILLGFVSYLSYLQSIGFAGLLTASKIIKKIINDEELLKAILEGSTQDGVEIFGFLLTRTTLYFFSGIVFFPLLIVFAKSYNYNLSFFIISLMIIFSFSIIIFFISTYVSISKSACKRKSVLIETFKKVYNYRLKNFLNEKSNSNVEEQILAELKIANVCRQIEKIEQINTNPVKVSKVVVVIFTVIFPVLFFIKDFVDFINSVLVRIT